MQNKFELKDGEFPLNEDFYVGENPDNLSPTTSLSDDNIDDFGEPLPKKYFDKLPEYLRYFSKPYISTSGKINFNIVFSDEFLLAMQLHYNLKEIPSNEKVCDLLRYEFETIFKNF